MHVDASADQSPFPREQMRLMHTMLASAPMGAKPAGARRSICSSRGRCGLVSTSSLHLSNNDRLMRRPIGPDELTEKVGGDFLRFAWRALREFGSGVLTRVVAPRQCRLRNDAPVEPLKVLARLSRDQAATLAVCRTPSGGSLEYLQQIGARTRRSIPVPSEGSTKTEKSRATLRCRLRSGDTG
jgi:hypothetical protein